MKEEQRSGKTQVNRRKAKPVRAVKPASGLSLRAVDEDLLVARDQLTELAYELRVGGLLIAASHCDEAVEDIEDHLERTQELSR